MTRPSQTPTTAQPHIWPSDLVLATRTGRGGAGGRATRIVEGVYYASVTRRLAAMAADVALILAGAFVLEFLSAPWTIDPSNSGSSAAGPGDGIFLVATLGTAAYFILAYCRSGATPGMVVFRLRVVDESTLGRLRVHQAVGRFLFWYCLTAIALLGLVLAVRDPRRRAWHDRASGTAVIEV